MYVYASVFSQVQEFRKGLSVENFLSLAVGVEPDGELYTTEFREIEGTVVLTSKDEVTLETLLNYRTPNPAITPYYQEKWIQLNPREHNEYCKIKDKNYQIEFLQSLVINESRIVLSVEYGEETPTPGHSQS